MLTNIITTIRLKFEDKFTEDDSVLIFNLSAHCEIIRMGYAKNEESDIIIV
jgi:CRISPR-associated protein Cas2